MDPKLYKAAATGNAEYFGKLSDNEWHEFGHMKSQKGNTILHIAAEHGKISTAKKIIGKCKSVIGEQNLDGDSPLHVAVRQKKNIKMVQLLLKEDERKKLVRIVNMKGDTALHEAVRFNNLKAVELLISEDQDLASVKNNEGEAPLFIGVDKGFYKVARHILKAAPTCSFAGSSGRNVLHASIIAAKQNRSYTILYPLCCALFAASAFLMIPFPLCCMVSFPLFLCRLLLKHLQFNNIGSDFIRVVHERDFSTIYEADQSGWIPIHYAVYIGNMEVVKLLLKLGGSAKSLKMKDNEGMSCLHIAAKGNQAFVFEELMEKYPYTKEYHDNEGRTPLHVAVEAENLHVIDRFMRPSFCDYFVNERDINGNTPLHLAAVQQHKTICEMLISHSRIDLRAANNDGLTAIDIIKSKDIISLKELSKYVFVSRETIKEYATFQKDEAQVDEPKEGAKKAKDHEAAVSMELANVNLIIVTIVATVTFTAGLTVPGGYSSEDDKSAAGTAILTKEAAFRVFVIANSLAFGVSTSLMTFRVWTSITRKDEYSKAFMKWSLFFRNFAVLAMVVAFLAGEYVVLANSRAFAATAVTVSCFAFSALILAIFFDDHTLRYF
ncbi:ankyrin repeat family protein [Euphorbia peplus]|nr:ankyrin repeat family protein [Euphorbia peplus]